MAARRLFLAIPLPGPLRDRIGKLMEPYRGIKGIAVTQPQNYHVTVHFYGSVDEEHLTPLMNSAREKIAAVGPFTLYTTSFIRMPDKRPGMIWLACAASKSFDGLAGRFQQLAEGGAIPGDSREQKPHITCARIKPFAKLPSGFPEMDAAGIPVDRVELWQSLPGERGVRYVSLATFQLGIKSEEQP